MTPAIDETITRDLAAVAADNRRAWRTADDALAGLDTPRPTASPSEAVTFGELTAIFARRVAWIASSSVGLVILSWLLLTTFLPSGFEEATTEMWVEYGVLEAATRTFVPMILIYGLARGVAARWFIASLQHSATPDATGRRLVRRVDGWALGLGLAAVATAVLVLGTLYYGLYRVVWSTQWYDSFLDDTTRGIRLRTLPVAAGAVVILAGAIARLRHRRIAAWLAYPGLIPGGLIAAKLTIVWATWRAYWPFAPTGDLPTLARLGLTIAGTISVLAIVVPIVLGLRARDERRLAALPAPTTDPAVLDARRVVIGRAAWLGAGVAVLLAVVFQLEMAGPYALLPTWLEHHFGMPVQIAAMQLMSWPWRIGLPVAAYLLGVRLAELAVARLVTRSAPDHRIAAIRALAERLVGWTYAAWIAGATALVLELVLFDAVLLRRNRYQMSDPQLLDRWGAQMMAVIALTTVVAIALARGWHRPSRWRCFLRHPAALALGTMLGALTFAFGKQLDFSMRTEWSQATRRWIPASDVLPLARPALILGVAAATFVLLTWAALLRCRRTP